MTLKLSTWLSPMDIMRIDSYTQSKDNEVKYWQNKYNELKRKCKCEASLNK